MPSFFYLKVHDALCEIFNVVRYIQRSVFRLESGVEIPSTAKQVSKKFKSGL